MAKIKLRIPDQVPWHVPGNRPMTTEERARFSEDELRTEVRAYEMGTESTPQLLQLRYPPDCLIRTHAHDVDEIIYVLEGEMRLGSRAVGPGSSLYVAGGTLYSFRAGAMGLTILNFRPRCDTTFILPEERRGGGR